MVPSSKVSESPGQTATQAPHPKHRRYPRLRVSDPEKFLQPFFTPMYTCLQTDGHSQVQSACIQRQKEGRDRDRMTLQSPRSPASLMPSGRRLPVSLRSNAKIFFIHRAPDKDLPAVDTAAYSPLFNRRNSADTKNNEKTACHVFSEKRTRWLPTTGSGASPLYCFIWIPPPYPMLSRT